MGVRISQMVLRIAGVLALILGILRWFGALPDSLLSIHMLLGIIVMLSLWVLGGFLFTVKGGLPLAIVAIVWGLILLIVGMGQQNWLVGSSHWIIQVLHLLLGLVAIGLGEMLGARYKRAHAPILAQKA